MLKIFGMENCKPVNTPITSGTKLMKATDTLKEWISNSTSQQLAVFCICLDGPDQTLLTPSALLPDSVQIPRKNIGLLSSAFFVSCKEQKAMDWNTQKGTMTGT